MTAILCLDCGTLCPANSRFCLHCGVPLRPERDPYTQPDGSPLAPETLLAGRYRIERQLSSGAFGRVYLAEDTALPSAHPVAVKELLDYPQETEPGRREAIGWFKREVATLLALRHPSIPTLHGYWAANPESGPFYLAMEYIPGRTLAEMLDSVGGPLPWRQVVAWGIALCDVLGYMHGQDPPYLFRDLTLPNIILDTRTEALVLVDFGLAGPATPGGATAAGTWGYVPFEQILGQPEPRSDLYALGAVLHALLSGQDPAATFARLQRESPDLELTLGVIFQPLPHEMLGIPEPLSRAIASATAFAVEDRYPDALTMAAALWQSLWQPAPDTQEPGTGGVITHLVVSPEGYGHALTLADAIAMAPPRSRIEVRPGRYTDPLVIDKPLEIVGSGTPGHVLVETATGECLRVRSAPVFVRGLTLRCNADPQHLGLAAVAVESGHLTLDECWVESETLDAVAIEASEAGALIRDCSITSAHGAGIRSAGSHNLQVADCEIAGCGLEGLSIAGGNPEFRRCIITDGKGAGVRLYEGATGRLEQCRVERNATAGLLISDEAKPLILDCQIRGNGCAGIVIGERGGGTVTGCDLRDNTCGPWEVDLFSELRIDRYGNREDGHP